MSLWSRLANVVRRERLSREIDEELESHIEEAIEQGRDPAEARRAFGSTLRRREESRDIRLVPWLESLRADVLFGWRQLWKNKVASAAAMLSLAVAIGGCISAFRLVDALLLRPLPVTDPAGLYDLSKEGTGPNGELLRYDEWAYPAFGRMRLAVRDQSELIGISQSERTDLTFGSDQEIEKAYVQYVSGWMFESFGLRPALGRLFSQGDDQTPGGHPYAILSYDYWTRRFAKDPKAIGRTFRLGNEVYEIVGVAPHPFSGIEPGTVTSIFLPMMMHPLVNRDDATWMRTIVRPRPGIALEPLRAKLSATSRAFEEERAKAFVGISKESLDRFLNYKVVLQPMATGVSELQQQYRPALVALSVLVGLVLLVACVNVANLLTAQAAARSREMALRVAIGAGRTRLVQLVLLESAILAALASALGALFAWWSAPFVLSRINPPDNPARLDLPADWRLMAFGVALAVGVTLLFGLIPALRASSIRPLSALKGGADPRSRQRLMHTLIAAQVAFCVFVLFVAGLFIGTLNRLVNQPTGFSSERILTLDTVTRSPQTPVFWNDVANQLRDVRGVETVAMAGWPLLQGTSANSLISINGAPASDVLTYFLNVSPGWLNAMKIALKDGRDFRAGDVAPGAAIVNEAFAKQYFNGENPVGKAFQRRQGEILYQIVGLVGDVRYRSIREPVLPVAFVPFQSTNAGGALRPVSEATFIVRTSASGPIPPVATLRQAVADARPGFRVSNVRTQTEINQSQTIRERLLAMLALFFSVVALALAGIGLYGVLDYSVLQRRREIGIRMALGARAIDVARRVTADVFSMVVTGAVAGLALGLASARYLATLLYQVKAGDTAMLVLPLLTIIGMALLGALPAVIRAIRIDPVKILRLD